MNTPDPRYDRHHDMLAAVGTLVLVIIASLLLILILQDYGIIT